MAKHAQEECDQHEQRRSTAVARVRNVAPIDARRPLAARTAKSRRNNAALALLQQDDDQQEQADEDVPPRRPRST
jgi:hypothetical protein